MHHTIGSARLKMPDVRSSLRFAANLTRVSPLQDTASPSLDRALSLNRSPSLRLPGLESSIDDSYETSWNVARYSDAAICAAFARLADSRCAYASEHPNHVRVFTVRIARQLGIEGERLTTLQIAALLHDIGKLGVPDSIWNKPGPLTESEYEIVKLHSAYTYEILNRIPGFQRVAEIASAHHERLDGSGYGRGLKGAEIDLDMRILAVADVFDALTDTRPYRRALSYAEAFRILRSEAGDKLDAGVAEALACSIHRSG